MKIHRAIFPLITVVYSLMFFAGCGRQSAESETKRVAPVKHEHRPPHGGTAVVLGAEAFHLELVRDGATGTLQTYVLDGEMDDFIRVAAPTIEVVVTVDGAVHPLVLRAVANPATGETVGDTALFEVQAEWLKTAREFDGVVPSITIRGATFIHVKFNFPRGNDRDLVHDAGPVSG